MRGTDKQTAQMLSYLSPETMVPQDHPLRVIRPLANAALERLSPAFSKLYSAIGRPSIPPEQLLRALLLQAFFSVQGYRISVFANCARRRVRKASSHPALLILPFIEPLEPSSLARLSAMRRNKAMF